MTVGTKAQTNSDGHSGICGRAEQVVIAHGTQLLKKVRRVLKSNHDLGRGGQRTPMARSEGNSTKIDHKVCERSALP